MVLEQSQRRLGRLDACELHERLVEQHRHVLGQLFE